MATNATPASAVSSSSNTLPQLSGGLHLKGVVIAVKKEEKQWEGKSYIQTTVGVSDGEQTYDVRWREDAPDKPAQVPALFAPIVLRVKRATTEKGKITLSGVFL